MFNTDYDNLKLQFGEIHSILDSCAFSNQDESIKTFEIINNKLEGIVNFLRKNNFDKDYVKNNLSQIKNKFSILQDSHPLLQNNSTNQLMLNTLQRETLSFNHLISNAENILVPNEFNTDPSINSSIEAKQKNEVINQKPLEELTKPLPSNNTATNNSNTTNANSKLISLINENRLNLLKTAKTERITIKKIQNKVDSLLDIPLFLVGLLLLPTAFTVSFFIPPIGIALFGAAFLIFVRAYFRDRKHSKLIKSPELNKLFYSRPDVKKLLFPRTVSHEEYLNSERLRAERKLMDNFLKYRLFKSKYAQSILESPDALNAFLKKHPPTNLNDLNEFYEFLIKESDINDSTKYSLLNNTNLDENSIDIILKYTDKT